MTVQCVTLIFYSVLVCVVLERLAALFCNRNASVLPSWAAYNSSSQKYVGGRLAGACARTFVAY